jgi:hypothetical protein
MADNPYAARPHSDSKVKQCPPDMPRGDSDEDKAARQLYWIRRGNALLAASGRYNLEWKAKDGHYWIEDRA